MLKKLFYPESIAVIGASNEPTKIGHIISKNILNSRYQGSLFLVNPKEKKILDHPVYNQITDIFEDIDLAIIAIPAKYVPNTLQNLGNRRTKFATIISAGFKESGNLELEDKILEIANKNKIRLIGPNCLGLMNLSDSTLRFNGSFGFTPKITGKAALISQSGALISSFLDMAEAKGFGFNKVVSLGNKSDLDEVDFVNYFQSDPEIEQIALYLEGFNRAEEFIKTIANSNKPIILIKSGKTEETKKAISSHTGSIAGNEKVAAMYLSEINTIQPKSLSEFFNTIFLFSRFNELKENNLVILTNAGGAGVLTLDGLAKTKLKASKISQQTQQKLISILPLASSIHNPIDILGDAEANRYFQSLQILLEDSKINTVIVILTPQANSQVELTAQMIVQLSQEYENKVILPVFLGGNKIAGAIEIFKKNNLPYFNSPLDALEALENLRQFSLESKNLTFLKPIEIKVNQDKLKEIRLEIQETKKNNLPSLEFSTLNKISQLLDLSLVEFEFVNQNNYEDLYNQFGSQSVVKVVSANTLHRTDKSMVKIGLESKDDLLNFVQQFSDKKIIIQKMIKKGIEVFIGINKDQQFGHSLVVGSGGIYTEVLSDLTLSPIPITRDRIKVAFAETKVWKFLNGYRNKFYQTEILLETIYKLTQFVLLVPEIESIDINPYICTQDTGGNIVDFKVLI